ncbi:hypothetical protein D3C71_1985770 [compost metagenome]
MLNLSVCGGGEYFGLVITLGRKQLYGDIQQFQPSVVILYVITITTQANTPRLISQSVFLLILSPNYELVNL